MKLRIATAVVASISMLAWFQAPAQDGATLFKTKCAACHGTEGLTPEQATALAAFVKALK